MHNLIASKKDKTKPLSWVQIGLISGPDVAIPAAYLRSSNFNILGSGIGLLSFQEMGKVVAESTKALAEGLFTADVEAVPISDIGLEWGKPFDSNARKYFVFDH